MKLIGVYRIVSKIKPSRCYIGSTINIHSRWNDHKSMLKRNGHYSKKLQYHFNKYGMDDLNFEFLLGCEEKELFDLEQFYIDVYKPYFNNRHSANSNLGLKRTEEQKKLMSEKRKGKPAWNKGIPRTKEERRRHSEIMKGRRHSPETIEKIRQKSIGHKYHPTPEAIEKMRKSLTGKKQSPETIEKRASKLRGIKRPYASENMIRIWKQRKLLKECA